MGGDWWRTGIDCTRTSVASQVHTRAKARLFVISHRIVGIQCSYYLVTLTLLIYSEMVLRENVVKTPSVAMHILRRYHSHILPGAKKEYQGLLAEKSKVEGGCDKISIIVM